jgi:hypothetical protein
LRAAGARARAARCDAALPEEAEMKTIDRDDLPCFRNQLEAA